MLDIIHVTDDDLYYQFEGAAPFLSLRVDGSYPRQQTVDPFPCYHHDLDLVKEVLQKSYDAFPIGVGVRCYVFQHETTSRFNGYCDYDYDYSAEVERGTPRPYSTKIYLNGKRTPLHPAMTRYVVSHEYGHAVEKWISYQRGETDVYPLREDYKKFRGEAPYTVSYTARCHHSNIGELFANDFRILMTGYETEFWPHPGPFKRPEEIPAIQEFWQSVKQSYAYVRT